VRRGGVAVMPGMVPGRADLQKGSGGAVQLRVVHQL
jgi:hypothetical protein